ncbi:putative proteinC DOMAIN CONTAINING PROTEIN 49 [Salix purpurea]|uniref:NAC domain-containing protein n=2 Tax=Salix purpurea TaxID=77065 RepID=A0A9Q0P1M5_SALPP|nr:putative proteinC DOMAIN CONTAINING PROTEIN 49 [Salix purpurea]
MWWINGSAPPAGLDPLYILNCAHHLLHTNSKPTASFFFICLTRRDQSTTKSTAMDFQPSHVGYGFHPTDEVLVNHYLRLKMLGGHEQDVSIIEEVNVCDYEPWELPGLIGNQDPNDPKCYFFSPRSYKHANSHRVNTKTEGGFWKLTGKDLIVKAKATKEHIANKKTMVFYQKSVPNGVRTNWIMHEYHPTFSFHNQREFVLCKLKKDPEAIMPAYEEGEASSTVTSHRLENHNSDTATSEIIP